MVVKMPSYTCLRDIDIDLRETPTSEARSVHFKAGQTYARPYALPTGVLSDGQTYFTQTLATPAVNRKAKFSAIVVTGQTVAIPYSSSQILFVAAIEDTVYTLGGDPQLLYIAQGVSFDSDLGWTYNSSVSVQSGKLFVEVS